MDHRRGFGWGVAVTFTFTFSLPAATTITVDRSGGGDYREIQPAIDTGTSEGAPPTDLDGNPRPSCEGVDMGAYEFMDCAKLVRFVRGNSNADDKTDISDAIAILGFLFLGTPEHLSCQGAADVDDNGVLEITDAVNLLGFQFLGGSAPAGPCPDCGADVTPDDLSCESFPGCP